MSKYTELLLDFMQKKNEIIRKHTQMDIFTPEDFEEVKSWRVKLCILALDKLNHRSNDINNCPWCLVTSGCYSCGYGKRHGDCGSRLSRYRRVKCILPYTDFTDMPGMSELVDDTKCRFRTILGLYGRLICSIAKTAFMSESYPR